MPPAGPGRNANLLIDPLVRHQPVGIDLPLLRRPPDGALRFAEMAAVVEAALIEETPKLREATAQRVGVHAPRARGLQPGRIDHVPATDERHELGGARGMLAGPPPLGHLPDAQVEARLEGDRKNTRLNANT